MRFEITFHTPFRVASGRAGDGSDTAVDHDALLPASSLKGLMRSAARDLLGLHDRQVAARGLPGLHDDQVGRVFGSYHRPSPWSWSDARVVGGGGAAADVRSRARIRIDAATSTVAKGALLIADEVHAASAVFSIDRTGWIEAADVAGHEAVLITAARAVTAVGGDRRRGLGWVTVTPVEPEWSAEHLRAAVELVRAAADARRGEPDQGTGKEQADG